MTMTSKRLKISLLSVVLLCSACEFERNIETRPKLERGLGKLTLAEEMEEFENYDKHHDRMAKAYHFEEVKKERKERRRNRRTKEGLQDGTLIEEYKKVGQDSAPRNNDDDE